MNGLYEEHEGVVGLYAGPIEVAIDDNSWVREGVIELDRSGGLAARISIDFMQEPDLWTLEHADVATP